MSRWRLAALVVLSVSAALLVGDAARIGSTLARTEPAPGADETVRMLEEMGYTVRFVRADPAALAEAPAEGRGLVVLGGSRPWTPDELESLRNFLADGGRALVLGEPGAAQVLGVAMAASSVLDPSGEGGVRVRMAAVEGTWAAAHPVQDGRAGARVVAWSAEESFVDADGDGVGREGDVPGPFTLAVATPDGKGMVAGAVAPSGETLRALLAEAFPPGIEVVMDDTRAAAGLDVPVRAAAGAILHLAHAPLLAAVHLALVALVAGALAWEGLRKDAQTTARTLEEPIPRPRRDSP